MGSPNVGRGPTVPAVKSHLKQNKEGRSFWNSQQGSWEEAYDRSDSKGDTVGSQWVGLYLKEEGEDVWEWNLQNFLCLVTVSRCQ